jgi:hypothetical protein
MSNKSIFPKRRGKEKSLKTAALTLASITKSNKKNSEKPEVIWHLMKTKRAEL